MSQTRSQLHRFAAALGALALTVTIGTVAPVLAAGALPPPVPGGVGAVLGADSREDAVNQREAAQRRQAEAQSELEGVNDQLAQTVLELTRVSGEVESATGEVEQATAEYGQAMRQWQEAQDRLAAANALKERLAAQIEAAQERLDSAHRAIGSLAVRSYREGASQSALALAATSATSQDFASASQARDTAARSESALVRELREDLAITRNQDQRQAAVREQIAELEGLASAAASKAEGIKARKEAKLGQLQQLQHQTQVLNEQLAAQKGSLEADLAQADADRAQAQAIIDRIDEENRRKAEEERRLAQASGKVATGYFGYPIEGPIYVNSPYGWRTHPVLGTRRLHAGVDFYSPCGQTQIASAPGTVAQTYESITGGQIVIINHGWVSGSSWQTAYLHLSQINVRPGQVVQRGDAIGRTGATGRVTGCHVHFEVSRNGSTIDPMTLPGF